MRSWHLKWLFAAATALAFAACGDGTESGSEATTSASGSSSGSGGEGQGGAGSTGGAAVTKEFCGAVAGPFCGALFSCCTALVVLEAYGGTEDACADLLTADCLGDTASQLEASIEAGKTILDKAQLDQCVSKLKAMSGGGAGCIEPPRVVLLTDCLAAYRGQIKAGDPCTWSPADLSFVHCNDGLCQQGICVPFPATGGSCNGATNLCNYTQGEWCLGDAATGTCGPRGDIGAPCSHPASKSYECKSASCGQDGKCAPPTAGGICEAAG